ncbi:glycosyltransferase [uncultured Winogradskyella sp.]|uniref:glycosyltransferase n=1 Tax=uncultured Winogradskyella sp. TaxID=395353 RepID=UPI0030DAD91E|tara:strand:+ start:122104 stop:123360 length:1257 start_codon:yes stop_codon:yes gene_type:complete
MVTNSLLVIGFVWPEPKSSAAGSRILQIIKQFQKQGYKVTFVSAAKTSPNTFNLASISVQTAPIILNDDSFNDFVVQLKPDVVLFDRFMTEEHYGWRVAECCPNALRVLDTEDFHGLRKARELALKQKRELCASHLQNEITKREIASIYRCDLSLMISESEIKYLTQTFKIDHSLLYYLPFLLEPISSATITQKPSFNARQHFITIGNFLHAPNYDAVLYLKETIWPLIKKQLPKAELHIYGAYPSQKVTQLNHTKEGFLIKGFTEDVATVMQNAKVCLAALRFGAGLKGKLIDAMQNGTPSVMTSIAAEGMFNTYTDLTKTITTNGFVEDNAEAFANKAIALYKDASVWETKQHAGYTILNDRFNTLNFEADFSSKIETLKTHLVMHRQHNFIGQLFMHQTMQSTKYMSKWIAEKNK